MWPAATLPSTAFDVVIQEQVAGEREERLLERDALGERSQSPFHLHARSEQLPVVVSGIHRISWRERAERNMRRGRKEGQTISRLLI